MNKKMLLVGSDQVWSLERIYRKHLLALGVQVDLFAAQNTFYEYYGKSIINKILYRAGLSGIHKAIGQNLLTKVDEFKPEVVWVFKGMEIEPTTLQTLKQQGVKLVNYNPDNPFYFSGSGSGNKNVSAGLSYYHAHYSYDRSIADRIRKEFKLPCFILPFGFELEDEQCANAQDQDEIVKVCFLGNPDEHRVKFVEAIANDLPVDVYGNDWQKFTNHPSISVHGPVYGLDFWKTLYRYRVQLNIMRPHNPGSHNMRSFEITGVGGIGLYPDTIDHQEYFADLGIARVYRNIEECKHQAKSLLALPIVEAIEIRKKARSLSLEKGYDYKSRTRQFLQDLSTLKTE